MKKNWLGRVEADAIRPRRFRQRPLVPDIEFQCTDEPYPGHWREFPDGWPAGDRLAATQSAFDALPPPWQRVIVLHDLEGRNDAVIAAELGLSVDEVRDLLTLARAAIRERLDDA